MRTDTLRAGDSQKLSMLWNGRGKKRPCSMSVLLLLFSNKGKENRYGEVVGWVMPISHKDICAIPLAQCPFAQFPLAQCPFARCPFARRTPAPPVLSRLPNPKVPICAIPVRAAKSCLSVIPDIF